MKHCCPNCGYEYDVKSSKADPNVKKVIVHYSEKFRQQYGTYPSIKWGACGTVAKRLLKDLGDEYVMQSIDSYLSSSDTFFREAGFPFLLLPSFIQKQAVKTSRADYGML